LAKKLIHEIQPLYWVGSCLVVLSFIVVNLSYQLRGKLLAIDQPQFLDKIKKFLVRRGYIKSHESLNDEITTEPI